MNKQEIFTKLFSYGWPNNEDLVQYANDKHGFGGDNGYYGVTYSTDLDEYEIVVEKIIIPDGYIEINYWDGEHLDMQVTESDYLSELRKHLKDTGNKELSKKLRHV